MTTVGNIYDFIDSFAPFENAMEFDNVGLLIGGREKPVTKAVVALDMASSVIDEAQKLGAQLIITHHPVIFHGMKSVPSNSFAHRLISSGISVISAHTNLDLSPVFGVNTCFAECLGLKDTSFPLEGHPIVLGTLEKPLTSEEFIEKVKKDLGTQSIRATSYKGTVEKVIVGGGACGEYSDRISALGAQAFVTGELKHHEFLTSVEDGYLGIDAGHFYTEDLVIKPLCDKLSKQFENIEFIPIDSCRPYL